MVVYSFPKFASPTLLKMATWLTHSPPITGFNKHNENTLGNRILLVESTLRKSWENKCDEESSLQEWSIGVVTVKPWLSFSSEKTFVNVLGDKAWFHVRIHRKNDPWGGQSTTCTEFFSLALPTIHSSIFLNVHFILPWIPYTMEDARIVSSLLYKTGLMQNSDRSESRVCSLDNGTAAMMSAVKRIGQSVTWYSTAGHQICSQHHPLQDLRKNMLVCCWRSTHNCCNGPDGEVLTSPWPWCTAAMTSSLLVFNAYLSGLCFLV